MPICADDVLNDMEQQLHTVIGTKMTDTTFKSSFPHSHPSFPRRNVTPYPDTGRESIFGHCRQPSELGGTNADFHPSVCRRQACMSDSSENNPNDATPSFLRRQESILRLLPREDDEAKPNFMIGGVGDNRHERLL